MKCNDVLYVIPTYRCNLKCPHCSIRNQEANENFELLKHNLEKSCFKEYLLFGGEPLIDLDKFYQLLGLNKITSIATNLLLFTDEIAEELKKRDILVATSWNQKRFTPEQYKQWHDKLSILDKHGINTTVLITLTEDLISVDPYEFCKSTIAEIHQHPAVDEIKFEYLVAESLSETYYRNVDDWLCGVHRSWPKGLINFIADQLQKKGNINSCHNVYTITPDGMMHSGCPNALCFKKTLFLKQCAKCKFSNICQPCVLQQKCSFPVKLYQLINGIVNNIKD